MSTANWKSSPKERLKLYPNFYIPSSWRASQNIEKIKIGTSSLSSGAALPNSSVQNFCIVILRQKQQTSPANKSSTNQNARSLTHVEFTQSVGFLASFALRTDRLPECYRSLLRRDWSIRRQSDDKQGKIRLRSSVVTAYTPRCWNTNRGLQLERPHWGAFGVETGRDEYRRC